MLFSMYFMVAFLMDSRVKPRMNNFRKTGVFLYMTLIENSLKYYNIFQLSLDMATVTDDINSRSPRALRRRAQGCPSGWPLLFKEAC